MTFVNTEVTLGSGVASGGTFTVPYPADTNAGTFYAGRDHKLFVNQTLFSAPDDFTVSFGASNATVTYNGDTALVAGATVGVQFDIVGSGDPPKTYLGEAQNSSLLTTVLINLGAPATADADGVIATQAITAASGPATGINGALATSGVATFDVPRNVVGAWTGTAVMTVTGTDAYGNVVKESSASGTSMAGKKAFKTVTAVAVSADVTAATVGTGDVLGLPSFLPEKGMVIGELEDGAAPTAGTIVAGVSSAATATTGDVRGTYDPNSAANGSKVFQLIVAVPDPSDLGRAQYAG